MLVFSLGRNGGMMDYAKSILSRVDLDDILVVFESEFSKNKFESEKSKFVPTYRDKFEFLLSIFTRLPFLLFQVLKFRRNKLYFPYFHPWSLPIIIVGRLTGSRIYFTVHDSIMHKGDYNFLEDFLLRKSIELSTDLIFLTNHVYEVTERHFNIRGKSIFLSKLGYLETEHDSKYTLKREFNGNSFLFLGRVSEYKGVEVLLECFSNSEILQEKRLTVAGKSNYVVPYESYDLKRLSVLDYFLPEEEIVELVNSHDVLVLPYIEATQSGVLGYALKSNTQVVLTNVGGLCEQIPPNCGVFCEPNAGSLKATLESVVRGDYSSNFATQDSYRKTISWDCIVRELMGFIDD